MNKYILSVVIPTKNRQKYCLAAIRQILSLQLNGVEICIQDNSDTDVLRSYISSLECNDIVYNYHQGILSFVDNFSEAVGLAHGKYICMIGDDDGILPSIMKVTQYIDKHQIDSVIPSLGAVYYWPSTNPIVSDGEKGVLTLSYLKSENKYTNSKRALVELLKGAVQNYTSLDLPRLYHGIVKKTSLDKIKKMTGSYFEGLTPDIYMAVALSFVCEKTIRIDYPVTISGICPTSGSTDSATGKHTGNLSDAPHFKGHTNYQWDDHIPTFYSVDTIWAETLMQALTKFGMEDMKSIFNLPLFEVLCMEKYPEFKNCIELHTTRNRVTNIAMKIQRIKHQWQLVLLSYKRKMNPKQKERFIGVEDIEGACEKCMEFLYQIKGRFLDY